MLPAETDRAGLAKRLALLWAVLVVITVAVAMERVVGLHLRGDDALRLVQVRDLVGGQGWYDLHQYRIAPPEGTLMHWSRLVDAPIAAIVLLFAPLVGQATAEIIALIAIPLLGLGLLVACVGWAANRLFGERVAGFAALSIGLLSPVLFQLQPMRIDHHGWQLVAFAFAVASLVVKDRVRGAWIAGVALGTGMTISLEMLPLAAAFGAVFAFRWLRDAKEGGTELVGFLHALAVTLMVLFFVALGPDAMTTYCDAIGPAHLALFATVALGTSVFARKTHLRPLAIVAGLGAVGAAGIAAFGFLEPDCLRTPFGALDPLVRDYWYTMIAEGRPAWDQTAAQAVPPVAQVLLALAATAALARCSRGPWRAFWFDYLLLLGASALLGVLVWRSIAFAGVMAAIPLGWLVARALDGIPKMRQPLAKAAAMAALVLALMPSIVFMAGDAIAPAQANDGALMAATASDDPVSVVDTDCLDRPTLDRLAALEPGTVFAPFDIGPAILLHTDHALVATGHHRAEAAMADTIAGFLAKPDVARAYVAKRGGDYVALCTDVADARMYAHAEPEGLAAALMAGEAPSWLAPVAGFTDGPLRVWRVR